MKIYFVAAAGDAAGPDWRTCGHEHPGFSGALDCAKRRGFGEVWSLQVKRVGKLPRAKTKVGTGT